MFPTVDKIKAQTLFHYSAKSSTRLVERDRVKKELEEQISRLRKLSGSKVESQIAELERKISAALEAENKLLGYKQQEDTFHRKLRDKVEQLDKKLATLLDGRQARTRRISELEDKIRMRLSSRRQKIEILRKNINSLEKMHNKLSKTEKNNPRLDSIRQRITSLKKLLKETEKK